MNRMEILIVGAGPAGMTLAVALQRQGVRFRIVDRDSGPADATRAPVLWQHTQEILAALGNQGGFPHEGCFESGFWSNADELFQRGPILLSAA